VLRVVLARSARSARRTTHFDLDFPQEPQTEPYWCFKHRRECKPVERAEHFVRRYTLDTLARLKEFGRVRSRRTADVLHGDARELELPGSFDAVVTSPPYPGLIDYHEQHRYAYELLGLDDLRQRELGAAAGGTSKAALAAYVEGIAGVLSACAGSLKPRGRIVIVVNDRRSLYPEILERSGFRLEQQYQRHVNRRTGRRAGEYFESVLVACRA
jgi:tRNA G10  N-methylase Trm11